MNRPPDPEDVLEVSELQELLFTLNPFGVDLDQVKCMQEALTCEWLIEYGFMPDPSEFVASGGKAATVLIQGMEHPVWVGNPNLDGWEYVDHDPFGKPSDYAVKR